MTTQILGKVQEVMLQRDLVAEIRLETITPILLGGYDTRHCHRLSKDLEIYEPLRPSSIKGLWRWWARALIVAAISDNSVTLDKIDKMVAQFLGSSERNIGCSKYSIITEIINVEKPLNISSKNKIFSKIPWIRLTGYQDKVLPPKTKCIVRIYKNRKTSRIEDKFAVLSLIIGLIFDGLGKAISRGFGKVKITSIKYIHDHGKEDRINRLVENIYKHSRFSDVKGMERALKKLIDEGIRAAVELLGKNVHVNTIKEMPLIEVPSINKGFMILKVLSCRFSRYEDALRCIGNVTLKLYHKALAIYKKRSLVNFRDALEQARGIRGNKFNTWILGLPRAQEPPIIEVDGSYDQAEKLVEKLKQRLKEKLEKILKQRGFEDGTLSKAVREFQRHIKLTVKRKGGIERIKIKIPTGYYFINKQGHVEKLRRRSAIRFTLVSPDHNSYYIVLYGFNTVDWKEKFSEGILLHIGVEYTQAQVLFKDINPFIIISINHNSIDVDKFISDIIENIQELIEKKFCLL